MKKYEVFVNNNLFKFEYVPKNASEKINDVIQFINQKQGFPVNAKLDIKIDNQSRDKYFDLKDAQTNIIQIKFSHEIETLTIAHISKEEKHNIVLDKVDTCQQLIEIEKRIQKKKKSEEYQIKILQQNNLLDRNLLLCQIYYYQQQINYLVLAMFFIKYNDKLQLFQIDAFTCIDKIKQSIRQKFGIDQEIELYFKGYLLEDNMTYYSYNIHQNAELQLKVNNMKNIKIQYQDKVYQFYVSVNYTIEDLIKFYQQSIHKNQILQVHYNNKQLENTVKIGSLDLQSNNLFIMTNKIPERFLMIKIAKIGKVQQQYFQQFLVSNLDYFQTIYEKQFFKGKLFEFYANDNLLKITHKLIFNDIQFKDNQYLIQYNLIQNYQIINVTFMNEKSDTFKVSVKSDDVIFEAIQKNVKFENIKITAYKKGQLLDLNSTYKQEEIQDGDVIYYCFDQMLKIQFMIWVKDQHEIKEMRIHYLDSVKELKQKIQNQYKINTNFQILVEQQVLDDDDLIKNYGEQTMYTINQEFEFTIELNLDNYSKQIVSKFYETDKIQKVKQYFKEIYEDEICIGVDSIKDLNVDEILQDYINKVLVVTKNNINVRYKFYGEETIYEKKFFMNITIVEMLTQIDNKRQSRCYIGGTQIDEQYSELNEFNVNQDTVIVIERISIAYFSEQNNKNNKFQLEFYPENTISEKFKDYVIERCKVYLGNREINMQKSFEDERIKNGSELSFFYIVTIEFYDFVTKVLQFKNTYNSNMKPSQFLKLKNTTRVYYLEKIIDIDKKLVELGVKDNSKFYIEECEKNLIIIEDDQEKNLIVDQYLTIGQLKQDLKLTNLNDKLYSKQNKTKPLQDDVVLKSLLNENQIELICKRDNNCIQITIIDNEDRQYIEHVYLNQQVKTFINEFKIKHNLGDIEIFYDGEVINQDDYFSQLNITQDAQFEIII